MKHRLTWLLCLLALMTTGFVSVSSQNNDASADYPNGEFLVSADWLDTHHTDSMIRIVDMRGRSAYADGHIPGAVNVPIHARSPKEYTGEVAFADRGGHIPGAIRLAWLDTMPKGDAIFTIESDWAEQLGDDDVEVFRPADEIETLLQEHNITPDKTIITYCQTYWRGAHLYFLLRLMGYVGRRTRI